MSELRVRSIAKGLSWRVIATLTTVALVFAFTGNVELAAGIGFLDITIKLCFYYLHERAWLSVAWGQSAKPTKPIAFPYLSIFKK